MGHPAAVDGDLAHGGVHAPPDDVAAGGKTGIDRRVAGARGGPALPDQRVRPAGGHGSADRTDLDLSSQQRGRRVKNKGADIIAKVKDDASRAGRARDGFVHRGLLVTTAFRSRRTACRRGCVRAGGSVTAVRVVGGGWSNRVYRLDAGAGSFAVKEMCNPWADPGWERWLAEAWSFEQRALAAGVSAPLPVANPADGGCLAWVRRQTGAARAAVRLHRWAEGRP